MSIATEITRLQGAKADLKTSIEAKGVTVPSATLISGYASLVDQIQVGGGIPDSDGLIDLSIANIDMTESASSLTLTYTPTYLLRYSPSTPVSNRSSMSVSTTVNYPSIVWTCSNQLITISGATATIPTGFNNDVVFTATWSDYNGDSHNTTKTVHLMNLKYARINVSSVNPNNKYIAITEWPNNVRKWGSMSEPSLSSIEDYQGWHICTGDAADYSLTWQSTFGAVSNNGSTASVFETVADTKAALDEMAT